MVGLVLEAPGEDLGALDGHRLAVHVEPRRDRAGGAADVLLQPGKGQAALGAVLAVLGELQHRVDQMAELAVDVPGEHPQPDADLGRGEPGARCVDHRVGQVGDELAQLAVEVDDLDRGGAQDGVTEQSDVLDRHGRYGFLTGMRSRRVRRATQV